MMDQSADANWVSKCCRVSQILAKSRDALKLCFIYVSEQELRLICWGGRRFDVDIKTDRRWIWRRLGELSVSTREEERAKRALLSQVCVHQLVPSSLFKHWNVYSLGLVCLGGWKRCFLNLALDNWTKKVSQSSSKRDTVRFVWGNPSRGKWVWKVVSCQKWTGFGGRVMFCARAIGLVFTLAFLHASTNLTQKVLKEMKENN